MTDGPDPQASDKETSWSVDPWGGPPPRRWLRCDQPQAARLTLAGLRAVAALDDGYRYDLRVGHPRIEPDPFGLGPLVLVCYEMTWLTWLDTPEVARTVRPPGRWLPAGLVYVDVPSLSGPGMGADGDHPAEACGEADGDANQ